MKSRLKTRVIVMCALMAALTAAGAFIRIPLPFMPFTLQTMFCLLAGLLLGSKAGALSQACYVLLGLTGIPVFTKGGGIWYVSEPSFGYLLGFILCAYVSGLIMERSGLTLVKKLVLASICGLLSVYVIGTPYMYFIYDYYLKADKGAAWAIYYGFITTIPGDIVKGTAAIIVARRAYGTGFIQPSLRNESST